MDRYHLRGRTTSHPPIEGHQMLDIAAGVGATLPTVVSGQELSELRYTGNEMEDRPQANPGDWASQLAVSDRLGEATLSSPIVQPTTTTTTPTKHHSHSAVGGVPAAEFTSPAVVISRDGRKLESTSPSLAPNDSERQHDASTLLEVASTSSNTGSTRSQSALLRMGRSRPVQDAGISIFDIRSLAGDSVEFDSDINMETETQTYPEESAVKKIRTEAKESPLKIKVRDSVTGNVSIQNAPSSILASPDLPCLIDQGLVFAGGLTARARTTVDDVMLNVCQPSTVRPHENALECTRPQAASASNIPRKRSVPTFRVPAPPLAPPPSLASNPSARPHRSETSVVRPAAIQRHATSEMTDTAQSLVMMSCSALTQPTVTLHERRPANSSSPYASVQSWLDTVPSEVQLASSRPSSCHTSVVMSSGLQAALPLGAEAITITAPRPSRISQRSGTTQQTRRSGRMSVSVPVEVFELTHKLTDNILQMATQQRNDAARREQDLRNDALQREHFLREEHSKRERIEAEIAFQREKLLVDAQNKDKERLALEIQRREEIARKEKQTERENVFMDAQKQMTLMEQLAEEKQRVILLKKEREIEKLRYDSNKKLMEEKHRFELMSQAAHDSSNVIETTSLESGSPQVVTVGGSPDSDIMSEQCSFPAPSQIKKKVSATVYAGEVRQPLYTPLATLMESFESNFSGVPAQPTIAMQTVPTYSITQPNFELSVQQPNVAPQVARKRIASLDLTTAPTQSVISHEFQTHSITGTYTLSNSPPVQTHEPGKINLLVASATKTAPTVIPINVSGPISRSIQATTVSALDPSSAPKILADVVSTSVAVESVPSMLSTHSVAASEVQTTLTAGSATTNASTPVVVVKQLEQVKPYSGMSSYKAYRDYFERVAKVNQWTTNAEKAQHLSLALEGAAVELLKEISEDRDDAYEQIWAALARRFGYIDEPERAMQRFESRRQIEGESIAVFEQALRTIHREAWPNADTQSKDGTLKRRFIAGLNNSEMQQFLRLHAKNDDFAQTVARARQFQDTQELVKPKKPAIRMATSCDQDRGSDSQIQPILDGLQRVLETVLDDRSRPAEVNQCNQGRKAEIYCVQGSSNSKSTSTGNRSKGQRQNSPAPSDLSGGNTSVSQGPGNRSRSVRFEDQSTDGNGPPSGQRQRNHGDRGNFRSSSVNRPIQVNSDNRGNGNWDRSPLRQGNYDNWGYDNRSRSPGQGFPRYRPPSSGDRDGVREPHQSQQWSSNGWPTDRSTFPWGRQRSSSADSSMSIDHRPLRDYNRLGPRQRWGSGSSGCRPPPGAVDQSPAGQENQPPGRQSSSTRPSGCFVCGQLGCHSRHHANGWVGPPRPTPIGCYVCGQYGCHSRNHAGNSVPAYPTNQVENPPRSTVGNQSNRQRGANQGDRVPPKMEAPRPQSD